MQLKSAENQHLEQSLPQTHGIHPRQQTLQRAVEARGIGVHSGSEVTLRLAPAPPDTGIIFIRTDLPEAPEIPARPENIDPAALQRMTVLKSSRHPEARVGMIEHLLAVCAGLGLSNLRVELNSMECPIFDGSGLEYVRLIEQAGLVQQDADLRRWKLKKPVALICDNAELIALPAERTRYTFFGEFRHAGLPDEQVTFELFADDFASKIAPARTFCFWQDIEKLLQAGLIKGGSTENAIVLRDGKPIKVGPDGKPDDDPNFRYRIPSELATHKLLDLIGDLSILGGPVKALISARATGHSLHQEFARMLMDEIEPDGRS